MSWRFVIITSGVSFIMSDSSSNVVGRFSTLSHNPRRGIACRKCRSTEIPLARRAPASQAGVFLNLEPVVGALLGVILLHEVLGSFSILGGLLVIGAAVFVAAK